MTADADRNCCDNPLCLGIYKQDRVFFEVDDQQLARGPCYGLRVNNDGAEEQQQE